MNVISRARRRLQVKAVSHAALVGAAGAGLTHLVMSWVSADTMTAIAMTAGVWALSCALVLARAWSRITRRMAAAAVQDAAGGLDNLVVTAEELSTTLAGVRPLLRDEIMRQANARLASVDVARVVPVTRWVALAVVATAAVGVHVVVGTSASARGFADEGPGTTSTRTPAAAGQITVSLVPPAYIGAPSTSLEDPRELRVIEGTKVTIEVSDPPHREEFIATTTRFMVLRVTDAVTSTVAERLLAVFVDPDQRPTVRIIEPGRDVMLAKPEGHITIEVEARDDLGLRSLSLRYTHVAGSGESFSFEEGEWPLALTERTTERWKARATIAVPALKLEDGDAIVYRAIAQDARPGADPAASESYLIEIGALGGAATAGAAIPEERDRMALSQQMVIVKTERLQAQQGQLNAEELLEQSRMLAVEQRMVKAEFVFLTGGEIEDEVEEATHSHELAEGRMENEGQAELLTAIREMSRAEARLNEADLTRALAFERAALKALQRAFDRRRYFLRTIAERARIDQSRRLSGDRDAARGTGRSMEPAMVPARVARTREVLRALLALRAGDAPQSPAAIARLASLVDAADVELQKAALALSSAATAEDTRRAIDALIERLGAGLGSGLPAPPRALPGGIR